MPEELTDLQVNEIWSQANPIAQTVYKMLRIMTDDPRVAFLALAHVATQTISICEEGNEARAEKKMDDFHELMKAIHKDFNKFCKEEESAAEK